MIEVEFSFKLVMGSEPRLIVIMIRFERTVKSKGTALTDEGERNPRHKDSDIVVTRGTRTPVCATELSVVSPESRQRSEIYIQELMYLYYFKNFRTYVATLPTRF